MYSDIVLPTCVSDYEGYHVELYRRFSALKSNFKNPHQSSSTSKSKP